MKTSEFMIILSHFLGCFNGLGMVYSFGYWMPALLDEFGGSQAQTQLMVGLLQSGFFLGGIPARLVLKKFGFRFTYLAGSAIMVVVLLIMSFAQELWVAYLVVLAGLGMHAPFLASGSLIPRHLSQQNAARYNAFAVTGSGFGTIAWANLARVLIPEVGWRVGLRVLAACVASLYLVGAVGQYEPPALSASDQKAADGGMFAVFKDPKFKITCAAVACSGFGYILPFAVQAVHAENIGLTSGESATVYTIFGTFSIAGRISAGLVAARCNPLVVWVGAYWAIGGCISLVAAAPNFEVLALGNAMLGLASGPMIALIIPGLRELVGLARIPDALVWIMVVQGMSSLPAPTVAGWLADQTGSYVEGILIGAGGVIMGAAALTVVTARALEERRALRKEAGQEEKPGKSGNAEAAAAAAAAAVQKPAEGEDEPAEEQKPKPAPVVVREVEP